MNNQSNSQRHKKILTPYEQRQHFLGKIVNTIVWTVLAITVVLWLIDWKYGVGAVFFGIWSSFWYERGKRSQVVDEYEQDGYIEDGLRWMFISWIVFAVLALAGAIWYACQSDDSLFS